MRPYPRVRPRSDEVRRLRPVADRRHIAFHRRRRAGQGHYTACPIPPVGESRGLVPWAWSKGAGSWTCALELGGDQAASLRRRLRQEPLLKRKAKRRAGKLQACWG